MSSVNVNYQAIGTLVSTMIRHNFGLPSDVKFCGITEERIFYKILLFDPSKRRRNSFNQETAACFEVYIHEKSDVIANLALVLFELFWQEIKGFEYWNDECCENALKNYYDRRGVLGYSVGSCFEQCDLAFYCPAKKLLNLLSILGYSESDVKLEEYKKKTIAKKQKDVVLHEQRRMSK